MYDVKGMNPVQIKRVIDRMNEEDRFFALAYLKHLVRRDGPAHRAELGARLGQMNRGKKILLSSVRRLHERLEAAGL
jgi:hypothetical protein